MKTVLALVLLSVSLISTGVRADEAKGNSHPCHQVKEACEGAGFKKGGHKDKKGLHKDCIMPIMSGQSVLGVTVAADVISACKAKKPNFGQPKK